MFILQYFHECHPKHLINTNVHLLSTPYHNVSQQGWWKNKGYFDNSNQKKNVTGWHLCSHDDPPFRSFGGLCNVSFRGTKHAGLFEGPRQKNTGENTAVICWEGILFKSWGWVSKMGFGGEAIYFWLLVVFFQCSDVLCWWEVIWINRVWFCFFVWRKSKQSMSWIKPKCEEW